MAEPQKQIAKVLRIWTTVMSNVRMRDRTVKILQYGSQMLLGYWGAALSRQGREALGLLQRSSSSSRKAFWMLKSITNMATAMQQWEDGYFSAASTLVQKLDAIENLFLVWYYWCETKTYFARAKLFGLTEKAIDYYTNLSWALGDTAYFAAAALRLVENSSRRRELGDLIAHRRHIYTAETLDNLQNELDCLQAAKGRLHSNFVIGILELAVSLEYAGFYRFMTGHNLYKTYIGACGVCSSALIIHNGVLDALAVEDARKPPENKVD